MRIPWFNRRSATSSDDLSCDVSHERTDDEVLLSLRLMQRYRVALHADGPRHARLANWPRGWRSALTTMLGAERAQRALRDLRATGVAVVAICPRELAEHYCNELLSQSLPCSISLV